MPRKGPAPRRELMPDPIYRSVVVTQLVNKVLLHGKRSISEHIVYKALDEITRSEMRAILNRLVEGRGVTVLFVTHSISEAVALSDRVLVSSPRPGRIVSDINIDLPRPRAAEVEDDPQFVALCARVRHALHHGMQS